MRIREIIVVEGWHDKQAVERAVDADIWVVGGDRFVPTLLDELARAGRHRGVIIFTDPDGAGERIRRRIEQVVPNCKHAFLARDKAVARRGRGLGVEHADARDIAEAIARARPSNAHQALATPAGSAGDRFTLDDLARHGLAHTPGAAERRRFVGERLRIGYANAQAFLRKLNALGVTRAEWDEAVALLDGGSAPRDGEASR
jgi:ribonuclease M5